MIGKSTQSDSFSSPDTSETRNCRRCNDWLSLESFGWRDKARTHPQAMCRYCRRKYDAARRSARRTGKALRWAGIVASAGDSAIASVAVAYLRAFNGQTGLAKAIDEAYQSYAPGSFGRARILFAYLRLMSALPPERHDLLSDEDLQERIDRATARMAAEVLRKVQRAKGE